MSNRSFRLLSALFPRAWRDRYADELADLCDEFIDAGEQARWRLALNIAVAASAERLRTWRHSGQRLVIGGGAAAVLAVGVLAAATNGFGSFGATLSSKGPVPVNAIFNGHINLSSIPDFVSVTSHGRIVGYTPKDELFPAPTNGVHLGLAGAPAIKAVYGPDLTTLIGHVYPGTGFVSAGSRPLTKTCEPEDKITNGRSDSLPCPSAGINVPNVIGVYTPTGVAKLSSLGLNIQIVNVKSGRETPGHIVSTSPVAGTTVTARSVITVDISVRTS